MRSPFIASLLGLTLTFAPSSASTQVVAAAKETPWELLQRAHNLQTLHQESSPSYHLAAEFHTFDATGTPDGDGTLDEVYQQGGTWKRTIVYRGATLVTVKRPHDPPMLKGDPKYVTSTEIEAIASLVEPIHFSPLQVQGKATTLPFKVGNLALQCVTVPPRTIAGGPGLQPIPQQASYCIDPVQGLLRIRQEPMHSVVFNNFTRIGELSFVRDITVRDHGHTRANLHVATLEANPAIANDAFSIPEGATVQKDAQDTFGTVFAGHRTGGAPPVYPPFAKKGHIEGIVLLRAQIGTDGRIRSLSIISSPDDSLSESAMEAVKTWTYTPYLLNGRPVAVDTTISVNFGL